MLNTPTEVRPITIDTTVLPRAHGSALFTRGQTQALVAATLGTAKDAQRLDSIKESGEVTRSFMLWVVVRLASKVLRDRNAALWRRSIALGYAARWPDPWRGDIQSHVMTSPRQRRNKPQE